jgi:hypothetical protein
LKINHLATLDWITDFVSAVTVKRRRRSSRNSAIWMQLTENRAWKNVNLLLPRGARKFRANKRHHFLSYAAPPKMFTGTSKSTRKSSTNRFGQKFVGKRKLITMQDIRTIIFLALEQKCGRLAEGYDNLYPLSLSVQCVQQPD